MFPVGSKSDWKPVFLTVTANWHWKRLVRGEIDRNRGPKPIGKPVFNRLKPRTDWKSDPPPNRLKSAPPNYTSCARFSRPVSTFPRGSKKVCFRDRKSVRKVYRKCPETHFRGGVEIDRKPDFGRFPGPRAENAISWQNRPNIAAPFYHIPAIISKPNL